MHIRPIRITNGTVGATGKPAPRPEEQGKPAPAEQTTHVPSPELAHYAGLVREAPETRDDVMGQVRDRLDAGYYLTDDAADRTAEAMLSGDE